MISVIKSQQDVAVVLSIFNEVWGAETLTEFVTNIQSNLCLLSKDNHTELVTGYLFYDRDIRNEDFLEITDIGILEKYRGRGFGKELVGHVCSMTRCARLCVKEDNIYARKLYTTLGFKEIQTIQNYYGVGSDGIRMEWKM